MVTSRRVSYILPSPDTQPPLLSLPPLGQQRQGHPSPFFIPKTDGSGFNTPGLSLGSRNPFLSPINDASPSPQPQKSHPRHCLGITSLALDTSTVLSDANSPGGILYTGGRDGLVASWELNITHRKRKGSKYEVLPGRGSHVKWERIGDGAEFFDDDEEDDPSHNEEDEDERLSSEDETDGWVGINGNGNKKGEIPYEHRWEIDKNELSRSRPPPTTFRQSAQTHTDWVNAMLLCNLNQTVITASSDRTIRAWNPHASSDDPASLSPSLVGSHRDYVRALAWAKYPGLLFSGALDRHLSIWDIKSQVHEPVFNIDLTKVDDYGGVGLEGERGSVYALGVDNAGQVLAAGTPERVVRLWDPRAGDHSIGKLIGHTDCVRSIIFSEDGRYMLTGSSDTTIKLWSLAAHRCLHTFNHHDSSVWSLHSTHPNLERFYSGSRDGNLCVTDLEQCTDISDGECVVLAREGDSNESKTGDEGIRCIAGMDDEFVWTATGSTEIRRWRDVGRRIDRLNKEYDGLSYNAPTERSPPTEVSLTVPSTLGSAVSSQQHNGFDAAGQDGPPASALPTTVRERIAGGSTHQRVSSISGSSIANSVTSQDGRNQHGLNGIPYQSLVCLGLPDSPYAFGFSRQDDPYKEEPSTADGQGLNGLLKPDGEGSPKRISFQTDREPPTANSARIDFEDREVASEAKPLRTTPDEIIAGRSGLVRSLILNDRQHVLTVDTEGEVAAWNIIRGVCVGRFSTTEVAEALHLERGENAPIAVRKHSQEVLEMVKERVEGETMVITWCQVDTKIGSLVVSLEEGRVFDAEVYADELGIEGFDGHREDIRINLGKWALANLFRGLIKAEEREVTDLAINSSTPSTVTSSLPGSVPRSPVISLAPISIERPTDIPHPHRKRAMTGSFSNPKPPSLNIPGLVSPASRPAILPEVFDENLSRSLPESTNFFQNFQALKTPVSPSISNNQPTLSPTNERSSNSRDYFTSKRKGDPSPSRETDKSLPTPSIPIQTPSTPGANASDTGGKKGFMGKMKGLGRRKQTESTMSPVIERARTPEDDGPKVSDREAEQLHILDTVRSHRFTPPGPSEAPFIPLPPSTALLISEESKDAGAWVVTYRSQVSSTERDMESLEMNSPLWLLDYLFANNTRLKDPVKFTFILEPAPGSNLKELPEGSARLSASRALRAKKISAFIVDKLELNANSLQSSMSNSSLNLSLKKPNSLLSAQSRVSASLQGRRSSTTTSTDDSSSQQQQQLQVPPEEIIELLCGNTLVNPKITLATLKAYYGSGPDMVLHYRFKKGVQA
ncbi:uncharacterized protein IL334_005084 [Kwoniella shivajii]|uniref:WD40 repeat-like protein n=1 Tax=Kwoniella shivajii TaxID=564305 RepID=A0ABZ1D258_9TREE|nr:hypothetical protein IL334_005084 [Kwoniella shivajii]